MYLDQVGGSLLCISRNLFNWPMYMQAKGGVNLAAIGVPDFC